MTFLKELKGNEIGIGTYYRIRNDNTIELGYENKLKEEYDNTRLIINPISMIICGQKTSRCKISWFNSSERVYFNKKISEYDQKYSYDIIVQFNIEKLFTDPNYYSFFMEQLLNKERIQKYLEYGMKENPKIKCGNYVGYIDYNEQGQLKRYFDEEIGTNCHYLEEKQEERTEHRKRLIEYYDKEIEIKEKELSELREKKNQVLKENNKNEIVKHTI